MFTRRKIVIALGASALVSSLSSFAQPQGKVWRVGFLAQRHMEFVDSDSYYGPFTQGMRELGYFEGRNLVVEWRSAEGKIERLPELAAELVRLKVNVLAATGALASLAAQKATTAIPIVMIGVGDPVGSGLVKSLARPGGNSTGLSNMNVDLGPKLLEMLRGMAPKVTRVAVLVNPSNVFHTLLLKNIQVAAQKLGVEIQPVEASTPEEIANGFAMMTRHNVGALIVSQEPFFQQQRTQIVELAATQRLPSIGGYGQYAEAGGLMSYGQNPRERYRRAATYIDKIFKGANPGDIPVEQPTQFELLINRKTANALGLKISNSLLAQATKVIE
ncbi:MAG: ABC transporter substrate-binding protein [Burkholderiales bacterium]